MKDPEFTSVQLLWVNMIMDTLGAMALASQKPVIERGNRVQKQEKQMDKEKEVLSGEVIRLVSVVST